VTAAETDDPEVKKPGYQVPVPQVSSNPKEANHISKGNLDSPGLPQTLHILKKKFSDTLSPSSLVPQPTDKTPPPSPIDGKKIGNHQKPVKPLSKTKNFFKILSTNTN
jgi:hypothetical protein